VSVVVYVSDFPYACLLSVRLTSLRFGLPTVCSEDENFNSAEDCQDSIDEDVAQVLKRMRSLFPSLPLPPLLYRSHVLPHTLSPLHLDVY